MLEEERDKAAATERSQQSEETRRQDEELKQRTDKRAAELAQQEHQANMAALQAQRTGNWYKKRIG